MRGLKVPSFYRFMFKEIVRELLQNYLNERSDLFLIDFEILSGNIIRIVVDGDNGVLVEDCMMISRAIEHNLDKDEYDFSLEVSSAGAYSTLTNTRQYAKNIGRVLSIETNLENYEAKLIEANDEDIKLKWKQRQPKKIGKGKITVEKEINILYKDINEAKVKIKF